MSFYNGDVTNLDEMSDIFSEIEKNEDDRNGTDSGGGESDWGDVLVASIGIVKLYYE